MIEAEKDVWWLLATLYLKQFNENSPPNLKQRHDRGKKSWLLTT